MGSGVGSDEKDVEYSVVVCLCNQYDSLCSRFPK